MNKPRKLSAATVRFSEEFLSDVENSAIVTSILKNQANKERKKLAKKGLVGLLKDIQFAEGLNDFIECKRTAVIRFELYKKPRFIQGYRITTP